MNDTWRERIDKIRFAVTQPFLRGRGIEIGPGVYPQSIPEGVYRECFDVRTRSELALHFGVPETSCPEVYPLSAFSSRFPQGADFVIAHNVLEHFPDPIGALIQWNRMVKEDGYVIISLPDSRSCQEDRDRVRPTFEHMLMDYLFERDGRTFESREHVYSFMFGWNDSGNYRGIDKTTLAFFAHQQANAEYNDLHWHAFDRDLGMKVILGAAMFDRRGIKLDMIASPDDAGIRRTEGDIIYVYRVLRANSETLPWNSVEFLAEVEHIKNKLGAALARLETGLKPE